MCAMSFPEVDTKYTILQNATLDHFEFGIFFLFYILSYCCLNAKALQFLIIILNLLWYFEILLYV